MAITTTIPTNLDFPNRGVLERDAFVLAQETAQDLLAGGYTTALNQYATELNNTEEDINLKWEQVKSQAVTGGYSQTYINATFTPKILDTQTAKTTPVDADLIPLSDSTSSFGLKKLSIVNLITKAKNDIISAFGALISGLTAKTTPSDADMIVIADSASENASKKLTFANLKAMIFTNSALTGTPTAPTATARTNTTQIATTAYVDGKMVLSTAVTASETAIDFTNIPSWAKRITVMFNGVSTSGTSQVQVQLGSTTIQTTGYLGTSMSNVSGVATANHSTGFLTNPVADVSAAAMRQGVMTLVLFGNNIWCETSITGLSNTAFNTQSSGSVTLSGTLYRLRITTVNGTDTFDAGQINIMYEG